MMTLSKDLSRPTHFEQLGITVEPKQFQENKKILISVETPPFERRAQFCGVSRKLTYDLPKDAAGLLGITRHEIVPKMDGEEEPITNFVDSKNRVGIISFFQLGEVTKPKDLVKGKFLAAHMPKKMINHTAKYRQFVRKTMAIFVKNAVRFYGLPPCCQVMQCLANCFKNFSYFIKI